MTDHAHSHADHGHDSHGHGSHGGHDHGSHGGLRKYIIVFGLLCILTTLSFFTYSDAWPWKDTPSVGWVFMMCVSCAKALLVMLFFMHLLWEADWKYVLTIPASIMSIFLVLALVPDIGRRVGGKESLYKYSDARMPYTANEATNAALVKASLEEQKKLHGAEHAGEAHGDQHAAPAPASH